jgi:hypothetical protein
MVDDNASICDGPVFGDALDFVVGKKKYGVSHLGNTGLELGQAMYFLAHCWHPHVLQVRIVLEFAILSDCLLGDRVDDAKTVVFKVDKWAGPLQLGGHLGGLEGHHVVHGLEQYVAGPACVDEPGGLPGMHGRSLGWLVVAVVVRSMTWYLGAKVGAGGQAHLVRGHILWAMACIGEAAVVGCNRGTMTSD